MIIIFFGTDEFAANILGHLLSRDFNIVAVITRPDKPQKRSKEPISPPVKEFLVKNDFKGVIHQPIRASSEDFEHVLKGYNPDLFVVVSYGQILKQNILDIPKLGCINVHPSLLPKYRGPSPMQSAVLSGEKETGVCIMEMTLAMDAGDIIKMSKMPIEDNATFGEVQESLCDMAKKMLVDVLKDFEHNKTLPKIKQNEEEASYTKKLEVEDSFIDWDKEAFLVHNFIRGMSPKPGARTYVMIDGEKKLLKIFRSQVISDIPSEKGKLVFFDKKNGFVVGCKKGALQILELQLEGKKLMTAKDFINSGKKPIFF